MSRPKSTSNWAACNCFPSEEPIDNVLETIESLPSAPTIIFPIKSVFPFPISTWEFLRSKPFTLCFKYSSAPASTACSARNLS